MKVVRPFKISGVGTYLPEKAISSNSLEKELGLPSGWCLKYSGVEKRHQASFETNSYMGAKALEQALAMAGLETKDLNGLIAASATYDYPLPNKASMIKKMLPNANDYDFPCIDLDTTCLSFVTALDYASRLLNNTDCQHLAIVSSEIASKGLNPDHPESYTLFGDAAAAIIISYDASGQSGVIKHEIKTYSKGAEYTIIKGGGNAFHFKDHPYHVGLHSFQMEGVKLLRLARKHLLEFTHDFFKQLPLAFHETDWIIPHQASRSGLMLLDEMLGSGSQSKVVNNLSIYGNCIAASIPLALAELVQSKEIKEGQTCLLIGTAAGFSIGAIFIKI